jgi:hypothetical protein
MWQSLRGSLTASHAKAASFASLLFIYPILVLSTLSVHYTETMHRITMERVFSQTIFGSVLADSLASIGFLALFVALTRGATWPKIIGMALFGAAIAAFVANIQQLVFFGFATLPALLLVLVLSSSRLQGGSAPQVAQFVTEFPRKTAALVYLGIVIAVEVGALGRWLSYPVFPTEIYGNQSWAVASLEAALFQVFDLLSPVILILAAFSFVYRWYVPAGLNKLIHRKGSRDPVDSVTGSKRNSFVPSDKVGDPDKKARSLSVHSNAGSAPTLAAYSVIRSNATRNVHLILLSAGLIAAPLLMIYPHLPGINLTGNGISTDERYYVGWTSSLRSLSDGSWGDTIAKAFTVNKGDRPLSLLVIILISNLTGASDLTVIRYLPAALAPLLVLSSYLLVRHAVKSEDQDRVRKYAALCAVFAAFSTQVVVGQYAGLLANWIGLVVSYFAFYSLIRAWEAPDRRRSLYFLGLTFAILTAIMLLHLYTWAHMLTVILLFAGASYILARKSVSEPAFKVLFMVVLVFAAFSLDYAKALYFSTPLVGEAGSVIIRNVQPEGVDNATRWDQLIFILQTYVGGFLSNPALFLLGLIWIIRSDLSAGLNRLMFVMICLTVIPFTFGNAEFQTRVLFNIPFHIPALLALFGARIQDKTVRYALIVSVTLFLATYAIRAMASLYLVLPEGYELERQFLLP